MKVTYQIRLTCYNYKTGKFVKRSMTFQSLEGVTKYAKYVDSLALHSWKNEKISSESREHASLHYAVDGYIESYDGTYKITEEKINF